MLWFETHEKLELLLARAASLGDLEAVRFLLDKGVDVNQQGPGGWTALMKAVCGRHLDVVEFLLKRGADASLLNDQGKSAMDYARASGDSGILACLRNAGPRSGAEGGS